MARSTATATAHIPLGSLTQRGARDGVSCSACGSERVTRLSMALTDGSPVEFTSCHRCEHRTWREHGLSGQILPVQRVLDKTRKHR
jgi:DNA-directed RNA polymerase subunit M/transcription elongation factor TFIIS